MFLRLTAAAIATGVCGNRDCGCSEPRNRYRTELRSIWYQDLIRRRYSYIWWICMHESGGSRALQALVNLAGKRTIHAVVRARARPSGTGRIEVDFCTTTTASTLCYISCKAFISRPSPIGIGYLNEPSLQVTHSGPHTPLRSEPQLRPASPSAVHCL